MNLRDLSIRRKLTLITTLTSSVALLLASIGFVVYDLATFRRNMGSDLTTQAQILGWNSRAALSFEEATSAAETLSALRVKPEVLAAALYLPDGRLFARYVRTDVSPETLPTAPQGTGVHFESGRLRVFHPIEFEREVLGTLYIESDMSQWYARLKRYTGIVGILMLGSVAAGLLLSARLQGVISRPIIDLRTAMRQVSDEKDYGLRVTKTNDDEIGHLIDGFNAMLSEIQERDETLEHRVAERSAAAETRAQELARIGEALRTQTRILNSILHSIGDGVVVADDNGRFILFNAAAEAILRTRLQDARATDWAEQNQLRMPDMVTPFASDDLPLARAIRGESVDAAEIYMSGVEGGVWLSVNARPLKSEEGGQHAGVAVFRDITAQKRSEEALRESEERYSLAVRGANDGIWDWNLKTNEVYLSPRWKAMLGYEEGEISSNPDEWFSRVHPEDLSRVRAEIAAHLDRKTPYYESEHQLLHKNGNYVWMLTRGLAFRDASGTPLRMAGSQTDVAAGKVADVLTGLPNRVLFMDRIGRAIDRARRRKGYMVAVLFVDLDRFKMVNDSLGHAMGDELLIGIARRLEGCLRQGDSLGRLVGHTVARLGGDEFTILLDDIKDVSDATRVADRITRALALPFDLNGQEVYVTASIGIAINATDHDLPEDLLRNADTAMYRAKTLGKARYEVFDTVMRERAIARLQLEQDLRRAVEHNEFRVHYQSIASLSTSRTIGFEALVRWQHPVRGLIQPVEFIPVAEETGLIIPLGRWVLHEACRQMHVWQQRYAAARALTISVNLSSKQFMQRDLIDQVRQVLEETSLDASRLKLEITESLIMEDPDLAITMLKQLRALDIQASIDDFGTGYSSLSYLHRFPVSTLKVDRSFVSAIRAASSEKSEIVRTIVTLAHNLGLDVVAEGVETAEQLVHLRAMECEYAQGYYFSVPISGDEAERLVASGDVL